MINPDQFKTINAVLEREIRALDPQPADADTILGWMAGLLCGAVYAMDKTKDDAHALLDRVWDSAINEAVSVLAGERDHDA